MPARGARIVLRARFAELELLKEARNYQELGWPGDGRNRFARDSGLGPSQYSVRSLGEFSLITVDRGRLHERAAGGDSRAAAQLAATRQLTRHLSAAQIGITLSSLLLGFIGEPVVVGLIHPVVRGLPLAEKDLALGLSVALALAISTYLQLVIGEQVPKAVAIANPLRWPRRAR